jgi:hypothetical protein
MILESIAHIRMKQYVDQWNQHLLPQQQPLHLTQPKKCDEANCQLPWCFCSSDGTNIPGGLEAKEIPQMILLMLNGAVNQINSPSYKRVFRKRKNQWMQYSRHIFPDTQLWQLPESLSCFQIFHVNFGYSGKLKGIGFAFGR